MTSLPKLKELSLDGNPCASKLEFNYELIVRIPKLKMLNDDTIKELDRDVAQQYLQMHGIIIDLKPIIKRDQITPAPAQPVTQEKPLQDQTSSTTNSQTISKKQVSFKAMNQTESEDYHQSVTNEML